MNTSLAWLLNPEVPTRKQALPPDASTIPASERKLEISVLFTSRESTIAAVRRAAAMLKGLDGRISLIDVQTVPYPLPLDRPPVALDFTQRRLLAIAAESELESKASVYFCRFRWETLLRILKPGSAIVIGTRKRWWTSREKKLARKLQRAGYQTLVVEA